MVAMALAPLVLLLAAVEGGAPPAADPPASSPVTAPAPAPAPAAAPADDARAAGDATAALRTSQDLEAKLIEMRRELDGLEKQRAAWNDLRRNLDDLSARVGEQARRADQGSSVSSSVSSSASAPSSSSPSPPPPLPPSGESGLVLRSRGGVSSLRPSMRLQAGYEGALVRRAPAQSVSTDNRWADRSGFLISHAELMLEGQVLYRRFEYRLLVDFAEPVVVKDAFIQGRVSRSLAVRIGQFKLPFGFQRYLRSTYYDFVDLSEAMAAFSLERDVGAMVVGRPLAGRLQYQLAVTNGAGTGVGKTNDNLDLAYTARIIAAPFGPLPESEGDQVGQRRPLLAVGAAGHFNLLPTDVVARTGDAAANVDLDGNGRVDNVAVWQGGVELRAHFRGAAVQGELFRRLEHPGVGAADRRTGGQYLQASYFVVPHFVAVAVRVERTDLPLYGVPLAVREVTGTRVDGQTGAVSAFLRGHDLKLQVDYSHLRTAGVAWAGGVYSPDSHRVRASAQLMF